MQCACRMDGSKSDSSSGMAHTYMYIHNYISQLRGCGKRRIDKITAIQYAADTDIGMGEQKFTTELSKA